MMVALGVEKPSSGFNEFEGEVNVPIMVTLIFMLAYLFVGSVAFVYAEGWPVGTAIYFCFVTLSTIGFGDFVPDRTFVKATEEKSIGGMLMMAFTIAYCIFGKIHNLAALRIK